MSSLKEKRKLLKSDFESLKNFVTDQAKGMKMPAIEPENKDTIIDLPKAAKSILKKENILRCLQERRSRRNLDKGELGLEELAYMLYLTQGVQRLFKRSEDYQVALRTVPSAGARHPFNTYILANKVEGLQRGIYCYQGIDHQLAHLKDLQLDKDKLTYAVNGQEFISEANVVFVWSAVPYRTEWRYAGESAKLILLDAGHVCQNLYLAAESLALGTCGIAAYRQKEIDDILGLDGEEEMVVYLAPVGVIS